MEVEEKSRPSEDKLRRHLSADSHPRWKIDGVPTVWLHLPTSSSFCCVLGGIFLLCATKLMCFVTACPNSFLPRNCNAFKWPTVLYFQPLIGDNLLVLSFGGAEDRARSIVEHSAYSWTVNTTFWAKREAVQCLRETWRIVFDSTLA